MSPRLREGIDAAKRGDKTTARRLLQQVLSTDGNNELALMWMASVVDALDERRFYLERALRVNPNNTRAREALRRLGVTEPEVNNAPRTRAGQTARPARTTNAPNTNLYLIAAAVVAVVVIAVIVASAISSLQPPATATPGVLAQQSLQLTLTARSALLVSPTPEPVEPTATLLPGVVVTLDPALVPTLPPTFTPTFTPPPTEAPEPTATPLPLGRFNIIYSDVEEGVEQASLYRARADGSGETKLASGADGGFNDVDYDPVNQRIVFVRRLPGTGEDAISELFVAPLDAPEDAEQITELGATLLEKPQWTPDGTAIVFTSNHDGDEEIWQISADGETLVQFTQNENLRDFDADISADGEWIVFATDRESPDFSQIYLMRGDGRDQERRTTVPISSDPAWSPDGQRIAYVNNQQGDDDIYVMDANGQRSFLLTVDDGGAVDSSPVWSPDGLWIFFASNRDGGETRWFAVDLQGNVRAITVGGRTPQTLSFITD